METQDAVGRTPTGLIDQPEMTEPQTQPQSGAGPVPPGARTEALSKAGSTTAEFGSGEPSVMEEFRAVRRYQPLRLHARGGLGEVFVAFDQEVGREVALKTLQERHADDPTARARFAVEAKITGKLEHPGIVAVHGFGQDDLGRLQYAMRLVRGETFGAAIVRYHKRFQDRRAAPDDPFRDLEFRHLLGRFVAACNAVAYAHSQGVLHRDIKPGNIMLGAYGETLVVDWGLAKHLGAADETGGPGGPGGPGVDDPTSSDHRTMPGEVLGTPAYMSPEQASGDPGAVGPPSDIYSLGASLYHLLAGRAPFEQNRLSELLRRVKAGEYPRPSLVRREVPPGLEVVCLKAMAVRPEDRYVHASELAEDVERWLADEPVLAAPEPWRARFRRWRRRRRTLLAAAGVLLLTATVSLGVGAALLAGERSAVLAARERSDRNYRLAGEAVDKYLRQIADDPRLQQEDAAALRRSLLASAVPFFQRVLEEDRDARDPKIRADRGRALSKLAFLYSQMAETSAALDAYQQAVDVFAALVADQPGEIAWEEELSLAHNGRANLLSVAHRFEEAEPHYRAATAIQRCHIEQFPDDHVHRHELARLLTNLGNMLRKQRRYAEAETHLRASVDLAESLAARRPEVETYRLGLGPAYHNLAHLFRETGRSGEAERCFRAALRALEALVAAKPGSDVIRRDWAVNYDAFALFLRGIGKMEEAEAAYRKSAEIHGRLAADFPSQTSYHDRLASSYWALGMMLRDTGWRPEGDKYIDLALAIGERLSRENPQSQELACRVAGARRDEGHWHRKNGRFDVALGWYDRGLAGLDEFTRRRPSSSMTEYAYRSITVHRARMLAEIGRASEALAGVERLLGRKNLPPENHYDAAAILALVAAKTSDAAASQHAARAIKLLQKAHAGGFFKPAKHRKFLVTDGALAYLRPTKGFQEFKELVGAQSTVAAAAANGR